MAFGKPARFKLWPVWLISLAFLTAIPPSRAVIKDFSREDIAQAVATGYSYSSQPQVLLEGTVYQSQAEELPAGQQQIDKEATPPPTVKNNSLRLITPYAGLSLEACRSSRQLKEIDQAALEHFTREPKLTFFVFSSGPVQWLEAEIKGEFMDIVYYPTPAPSDGWEKQFLDWLETDDKSYRYIYELPLSGVNPDDKLYLTVGQAIQENSYQIDLGQIK